jgi:hypothetical protein
MVATAEYLNIQQLCHVTSVSGSPAHSGGECFQGESYVTLKGILAAAVVIASLVSIGVTQPAFAAGNPTFGSGGKVVTQLGLDASGQQIQAQPSDGALQSLPRVEQRDSNGMWA